MEKSELEAISSLGMIEPNTMKVYGWRKFFDSGVLMDARTILEMDAVACITKEGLIHGKVDDGDRVYVVDIQIDEKGTIKSMMCSCSHDGCCSHMAAVLYEAERKESNVDMESGEENLPDCMHMWEDRSECSEEDEERLLSTIDQMSESQLKTALYHFGKRFSFLRENLVTKYSSKMTSELAENVQHMIEEVEYEFKDEYNRDFIRDEKGYVDRVESILSRFIPRFLREDLLKEAVDITTRALQDVGWQFLSDDDLKSQFGVVIAGYWKAIFAGADDDVKEYLFKELKEIEEYDGNDSFVIETVFDFRNIVFDDEAYVRAMIEERMAFIDSDNDDNYDEWYFALLYDKSATFIAEKFCSGFAEESEIVDFAMEHHDSRGASERILEYFRDNGLEREEQELLDLILHGDNLDYDSNEIFKTKDIEEMVEREYYLILLKKSYKEVADFLVEQIFDLKRYFLVSHFSSLKSYLDKSLWEEIDGCIYREALNRNIGFDMKLPLLRFMLQEGDSEKVFRVLETSNVSYKKFSTLADILVYEDEDRTFAIHLKALLLMMKGVNCRNGYSTVIRELKLVENIYSNGEDRAREVAEAWRKIHPERTAMMDELEKAGY